MWQPWHSRRRRMTLDPSRGRESSTRSCSWPQKGHFIGYSRLPIGELRLGCYVISLNVRLFIVNLESKIENGCLGGPQPVENVHNITTIRSRGQARKLRYEQGRRMRCSALRMGCGWRGSGGAERQALEEGRAFVIGRVIWILIGTSRLV